MIERRKRPGTAFAIYVNQRLMRDCCNTQI